MSGKEELIDKIAVLIYEVLTNADDPQVIAKVKAEVKETMNAYPMNAW